MVALLLGRGVVAAAEPPSAALPLLHEGRPQLPVIVPAAAAADELAAQSEWLRAWEKISGAAPPLWSGSGEPPAGVFIGATEPGRALLAAHPPGDPDGFVIAVEPAQQRVILAGATPLATYFAVCWFLQQHHLANWYVPGDLGEVMPRRREWAAPAGLVVQKPAYLSRVFSGMSTPEEQRWARRNLLNARFAFHHNFQNVLPAAMFDERPHYFALRGGQRANPRLEGGTAWQPDLANEEVAAWAASGARIFFDGQPGAFSYSLGLNDNVAFDEGPDTRALVEPRRWFRGRPDYSDLVFTFMNRAAGFLAPYYPDKYLGCLAYFWCENTPTFPVHPQVLPYLTNDRSFYTNAAWAAEDLALIARWAHVGPRLIGLYDYYYGQPFATPRVFTPALVQSLREGYARGARAFYAELYPVWEYDGLKAWLAARLLWDPAADAAALEEQFFQGLYGAAGPAVRAFFAACARAWAEQPGPPAWIKGYRYPYHPLMFQPEALAEAAPAVPGALAGTPEGTRLERLRDQAYWSDLAVQFAHAQARLAASPADRAREVAQGREDLVLLAALRSQALNLRPANGVSAAGVVYAPDAGPGFLLRAGDWARRRDQAEPLLQALARDLRPVRWGERHLPANWAETAGTLFQPRGPNLLHNEALAAPAAGQAPANWTFASRDAEFLRYGPAAGGGFRVAGSDWSVLWQDAPVTPGQLYETSFAWRGRITFGSRVYASVVYYDQGGKALATPWQMAAPPGRAGEWLRDGAVTRAPAGAARVRLLLYVTGQFPGDWLDLTGALAAAIQTETPAPWTASRLVRLGNSEAASFWFKD